jgi:hypothetical protein
MTIPNNQPPRSSSSTGPAGALAALRDSDPLVNPTCVGSILHEFEQGPSIRLHLGEARNDTPRFYPVNSPSFENVVVGSNAL